MKLKKIASLALAGVMAVSMLAGCGTDKKPGTGEGEGQGPVTTTGTSAEFGKVVDLDDDHAAYITFKDNADDQAALKKGTEFMQDATVVQLARNATPWALTNSALDQGVVALNKKMAELLDLAYMNDGTIGTMTEATSVNDVARAGVVYAINGTITEEAAVNLVAKTMKNKIVSLPDESANQVKYNYNYVVSVSSASKSIADTSVLPDGQNYNGTVNLVLVTVTRTATLAG